jgi:hypothetical protein
MDPAAKTQHAIRRSTRLPLEIPVLVTSGDAARPFSEPCQTTLVNAHGCGLIAPREFPHGIRVRLEIVSAKRHTTARVAEVVPLGGDPETWLIGLELDVPGNFWGIEYAPSDWKIEESPAAVAEPKLADPTPNAEKPVRSRPWRLTDISAGACYLEAAAPFPVGTSVLLSIRALNAECLLEGIVRVSHEQTGMGIEFTGAEARARRAKVEQLIDRLMSNREVPRIFVGRKEGHKEDRKEGRKQERDEYPRGNSNEGQHSMLISSQEVAQDAESPDPLLTLIREGKPLTPEQFLSDLRAQRLGTRRDPQVEIALPVLLTGTDVSGRPLDQRVMTVSISRDGALLQGIHGMLGAGDDISLARGHKKERFRVAWVGEQDTPTDGQIGVTALDSNSSFWDDALTATAEPGMETTSFRGKERGTPSERE